MLTKDDLKKYASKLMFTMKESEYDTLLEEFKIMMDEVKKISEIDGLDKYEPMNYPFVLDSSYLREDIVKESISVKDALSNTKEVMDNRVKLPKVVK